LRHDIRTKISRVLNLAVEAADQGNAAEERRIAIHNTQLRADGLAIEGVVESILRANKAHARFVPQGRTDRIRPADGSFVRMIEVGTAAEAVARGQVRKERLLRLVGTPPAEPS